MVWGNSHAPVMLIGQAPSKSVHQTGKPFNDASGKRLRRWLNVSEEVFWDQDTFYISAVGHCFPGKSPKAGGGDLKPPRLCADIWLKEEVRLLKPELYILVGAMAASFFYPKKKLSELVFDSLMFEGKPVFVLPHPSPLNQKWFKDHPEFEAEVLPVLQQQLSRALVC